MGKKGSSKKTERPVGPRGGTTTISESGMIRKNLWLSAELCEALRHKAFEERRTEADIIKEALRRMLGDAG
ncbi:MAG: hypothetical protein ACREKH_01950 [Candidatus Rokuibacteriota bacterium]